MTVMNPILKNIAAVIIGLMIGSAVNMMIIIMGPSIIPPPEGAVVTTNEGLQASMHLFGPEHFIMPFLAHALGTFVGALLPVVIGLSLGFKIALGFALFFFVVVFLWL